ncbi:MAG: hypothetical protein AB8B89_04930 [Gammaproteobacteria bacterium]
MSAVVKIILNRSLFVAALLLLLYGCHDSDLGEPWRITVGLDVPKEMIFVDGDITQEVRICLNTMGGSGYPTRVSARYDDERYTPMLVGQCMFFKGKRVSVKFANPSSGKYASGTYKVIR